MLIRRHFGTKCPMELQLDKEEENGRVSSSESESIPYVGWLVVLLFNVHGKHLRSCRDGQLT